MATDDAPPRPGKDEPPSSPATDDRDDYRVSLVHWPAVRDDLDALVSGEVRFDEYLQALYTTDASAYEVPSVEVAFPSSTADVAAIVGYCNEHSLAVLLGSGGTSLAGQTVNRGLCWVFTRHMDDALTFDSAQRRARLQPWTTVADLNQATADHDLKIAPDLLTANRSPIGGVVGNNTSAAHSLKCGKTEVYADELGVVLADGDDVRKYPSRNCATAGQ